MERLKTIITEKGYTIAAFAEICLGMEYTTFAYRCRHSAFKVREIVKICKMLGVKFEDIIDRAK